MRLIRLVVLAAIAIALVTVALANRNPLTIRLLPEELAGLFGFSWQVTLPAFLILLSAVAVGVLLGFVWEWVREHKHRSRASVEGRTRRQLEGELKKVAPSEKTGDDVLAIVEGR